RRQRSVFDATQRGKAARQRVRKRRLSRTAAKALEARPRSIRRELQDRHVAAQLLLPEGEISAPLPSVQVLPLPGSNLAVLNRQLRKNRFAAGSTRGAQRRQLAQHYASR